MKYDRLTLCKPCAAGLSHQGKPLKALPGKTNKITCAECGRRRYGLVYVAIPSDPKEAIDVKTHDGVQREHRSI